MHTSGRWLLASGTALLLAGCVPSLCPEVSQLPQQDLVFAFGDSVLAWNQVYCQAVPDHLALERGAAVDSAAISGARMLSGEGDIPDQYVSLDWDWVILDGGANDLKDACAGDQAGSILDQLVGPEGSGGAMGALLDQVLLDSDQVLLLGYYRMLPDAWYGFDKCEIELDSLNARYQALADKLDGVSYVDLGQVMDPELSPDAYAPDGAHPNTDGAQRIAELIHSTMVGLGQD